MPVEEWYSQLPIVTKSYVTLSFLTTAGCALEVITPFNVYFNARLIFQKLEIWRLLTSFLYFGGLGLDFMFHMFFLLKYSKLLEEGSFRGRSADFLWMLIVGAAQLMLLAPFVNVQFLGFSLTYMMVYVWSRRHPYMQLSFLGLFTFSAPYLPWVLLGFSVMIGSSPVVDILGMIAGHVYYFLEDVYPQMSGRHILQTPGIVKALFPTPDVMPPPDAAFAADAQH
eukprot:evm.model.scf_344.4 EVM.evm.TU.scf_344.4   scf_344:45187-52607(-)